MLELPSLPPSSKTFALGPAAMARTSVLTLAVAASWGCGGSSIDAVGDASGDGRMEGDGRDPDPQRAWSTPVQVGADLTFDRLSSNFALGIGGDRAIVMWSRLGAEVANVTGEQYSIASERWESVLFDENAYQPTLAVDGLGSIVAGWTGYNEALERLQVKTSRLPAASDVWSEPELMGGAEQRTSQPTVASNASGDAVMLWEEEVGAGSDYVWRSSQLSAAADRWEALAPLDFDPDRVGKLSVDDQGDVSLLWLQYHDARSSLDVDLWARQRSGAGWTTPMAIDVNDDTVDEEEYASNGRGDLVVVWMQDDGTGRRGVWSRRYDANTAGWDAPVLLDTSTAIVGNPSVALDASGNAIAMWDWSDGTRSHIRLRRFSIDSSSWSAAEPIDGEDAHSVEPSVAMEPAGDALAVFARDVGDDRYLVVTRYSASTGTWGAPTALEAAEGDASTPRISMDGDGRAIVVWQRSSNLWTSVLH